MGNQPPLRWELVERRLLIVDDNEAIQHAFAQILSSRGAETDCASSGDEALRLIRAREYDAILLDLSMPEVSGWDVVARMSELESHPPVLIVSAHAEFDSAVRALRGGVRDYIAKPVRAKELIDRVCAALPPRNPKSGKPPPPRHAPVPVCESPAMRDTLEQARRVAESSSWPVLLLGESGVGKEVVAAYIHEHSARASQPFVRVNLAAIPEQLVEAELFGNVKGAFTGAERDRAGHFASAHRGTLLLDEFCEFHTHLQPKLLRALEQRSFYPVGASEETVVDIRPIAATNRDPEKAMAKGRLRRDLFFRISRAIIRIPPLRERTADLVALAQRFADAACRELGYSEAQLPGIVIDALLAHPWPGNVRELKNAIERAVLMSAGDPLRPDHLSLRQEIPDGTGDAGGTPVAMKEAVEAAERASIERALLLSDHSPSRAAELLQISRTTLWKRMRKYSLEP